MAVGEVFGAIGILGGLAAAFGAAIAVVSARFAVWEDPRVNVVRDLLPGADCGACGQAGCRAFAEAVIAGRATPAECTVMGPDARADLADYLGVAVGSAERRVARLLCAGGHLVAPYKADYHGIASCAAAAAVAGGGKACPWGCLGYADCAVACDFNAIHMSRFGLPVVELDRCTACGDCVEACPLDLFVVMPAEHHLVVQCRNLLRGEAAEAVCSVACNACGRCVMDAAPGLIEISQGLAVVDYEKIHMENPRATERCPTGAIVWLEGQQFPELRAGVGA